MVTVMTWATSGGSKGRCDGRCHKAKYSKCACVCGGGFLVFKRAIAEEGQTR